MKYSIIFIITLIFAIGCNEATSTAYETETDTNISDTTDTDTISTEVSTDTIDTDSISDSTQSTDSNTSEESTDTIPDCSEEDLPVDACDEDGNLTLYTGEARYNTELEECVFETTTINCTEFNQVVLFTEENIIKSASELIISTCVEDSTADSYCLSFEEFMEKLSNTRISGDELQACIGDYAMNTYVYKYTELYQVETDPANQYRVDTIPNWDEASSQIYCPNGCRELSPEESNGGPTARCIEDTDD